MTQPTTHEVVLPLFSAMTQAPTKRYRTIVADPPWRYNMKPPEGGTTYPTMTTPELCNMGLGRWAYDDSHLYLWTTNSFLVEAHQIARAWGFEPKTLITWIKRRQPRGEEPTSLDDKWIGMGFYYRGVTEHVLFAIRGKLAVLNKDQANILYAPHGTHSEKPAAFYDMVERMSPGPYLDVFARTQRFNWDTFGNEAYDFREHGIWHKEAE